MRYLKKKSTKAVPGNFNLPSGFGDDVARISVMLDEYNETDLPEVDVSIEDLALDDPNDLRALAKWFEEAADFIESETMEG